jgi:hypothetical protein
VPAGRRGPTQKGPGDDAGGAGEGEDRDRPVARCRRRRPDGDLNDRRSDERGREHADQSPPHDPQPPVRNPQHESDDRNDEGEIQGTCPARVGQREGDRVAGDRGDAGDDGQGQALGTSSRPASRASAPSPRRCCAINNRPVPRKTPWSGG